MHIFLCFFYFLDYNIIFSYRHVDVVLFFFYLFRPQHLRAQKYEIWLYLDEQQRENKGFILLTPDSRGQNLHSPRRHCRKNHESQDGGRDRKPSRTAAHIILCEHTVRWARDTQA